MSRLQAVLAGMCCLVLALGPSVAQAQPMPENNPQACHDGYDNDGNGYVDCQDPACAQFCQTQYQQPPPPPQYPPPQYQQPPPGYYAPPPPQYVQPVYVVARPPRSGIPQIVTGFILLPLGVIFIAASAVLWNNSCAAGQTCFDFPGSDDYNNAYGALALDLIGIPFVIAGLILIPVGFARQARYNAWRQSHPGYVLYQKNGLTLEPVFGRATSLTTASAASGSTSLASGSLGLKLTW